mgnify:CR=1 FL=1|jgi:hypothetical protein|tara:strand:+ start:513 stop:1619 length:1107 start_codon:yes stop_codon:yes gene_type:complete
MNDISYFQDIPKLSIKFLEKLKQDSKFQYLPVINSNTTIGKKINMGYNCYAIKLYKLSNEWDNLDKTYRSQWSNYLLNFQKHNNNQLKNYFIDPELIKYFDKNISIYNVKNLTKSTLNKFLKKDYELKQRHIFKTLNADSKQTISTLSEIDFQIQNSPIKFFNEYSCVEEYLNSYNWSKPWDAGAQFSSISVYNSTFDLNLENNLINFIESKLDHETGSYFDSKPESSRQVINGAMKVISGLDWLNRPVHLPEKLIDFCLNNKPEFEGCDLVDYVYVLYKCSIQTNYRKKEILQIFHEVLDYLTLLYHKEENGFSYYVNKSQTHYYGVEISKGKNTPDIHGTILSIWAVVMILTLFEKNPYEYNIIKP